MSIVAELEVPADRFALGETMRAAPEADVEFERIVTHSQELVMPFLWVRGDDRDRFEEAIARDPTVERFQVTDRFEGQVDLYRIEWSDDVRRRINAIFARTGSLVEAVGARGTWELTVRFDDRSSLSSLQAHFDGEPGAVRLQRLYTPSRPQQPVTDLTPEQRATLLAAVEQGYFEVPRKAKLAEVASELGVSTSAASERLRRAIVTLTRNTVAPDERQGASTRGRPGQQDGSL